MKFPLIDSPWRIGLLSFCVHRDPMNRSATKPRKKLVILFADLRADGFFSTKDTLKWTSEWSGEQPRSSRPTPVGCWTITAIRLDQRLEENNSTRDGHVQVIGCVDRQHQRRAAWVPGVFTGLFQDLDPFLLSSSRSQPKPLQGHVNETIDRYQRQRKSNGSVTNRKSSSSIVRGIFILRTLCTHGRTDPIWLK